MNMKVDKAFVERVIFKSSSFCLELSFWKYGMLFGANIRAMLTNQWFKHTWSIEHFILQRK